jgi:transcriptional regulator GlxA family with amidase domain
MTTFGLVVFDDAEELDFVGPWEVITASAMILDLQGGETRDQAFLVSQTLDPVRCNKGLRVLPDHSFDDHPDIDVVLVPGGMGTRKEVDNPTVMQWLADVGSKAEWVTSVCTGSLLTVASGLAKDRRVATHWSFEDTLDQRPDCTVVRDARWVRDGNVVSSQGVSAGIDMTLWLVGQIHGRAHAKTTQHYIQYEPAPPYQADC